MNRPELLNYLIDRCGYSAYLEIGCHANWTFDRVNAAHKVGVDPDRGGTLRLTSDRFFEINQEQFDLIFIDGLHLAEQVLRDVDNALAVLREGGSIVLHDCLPEKEWHQVRQKSSPDPAWTGDVWKAVVELRTRAEIDIATLDDDWGLGLIRQSPNTAPLKSKPAVLDWPTFVERRGELLRVMAWEEFAEWIERGVAATTLD